MLLTIPSEDAQSGCEPEIIVKMALELDCVGPSVYAATEALLNRRELVRVGRTPGAAPQDRDAVKRLWRFVASPERLEAELAISPRMGTPSRSWWTASGLAAVNSLLDHLGRTDDRSTRAALMKQLLALGPRMGEVAVARLPTRHGTCSETFWC